MNCSNRSVRIGELFKLLLSSELLPNCFSPSEYLSLENIFISMLLKTCVTISFLSAAYIQVFFLILAINIIPMSPVSINAASHILATSPSSLLRGISMGAASVLYSNTIYFSKIRCRTCTDYQSIYHQSSEPIGISNRLVEVTFPDRSRARRTPRTSFSAHLGSYPYWYH